jgi:hypothetical protein
VTVFVGDDVECRNYKVALADTPYDKIVVGQVGLCAIRNFITAYYSEGTLLLSMDDDLQQILRKVDHKCFSQVRSLETEVIEPGFRACERHHARLWGVYAAANPFFMKHRVSVGLYFIVGSLFGCINRRGARYQITLDEKDDYERSIQFYLADGAVCRLDSVTVKTRYYREPGGMQVNRTPQRSYDCAKYLVDTYPDLCRLDKRARRSGHAELRLKAT